MKFLDIHGNDQPMTPELSARTWLALVGILTLWAATVVAGFCL
jgi:hypothetical protein